MDLLKQLFKKIIGVKIQLRSGNCFKEKVGYSVSFLVVDAGQM